MSPGPPRQLSGAPRRRCPVGPSRPSRRGCHSRPLLAGAPLEARLEALLRERAPLYESMAEVRVGTENEAPEEIATRVLAGLDAVRGVR